MKKSSRKVSSPKTSKKKRSSKEEMFTGVTPPNVIRAVGALPQKRLPIRDFLHLLLEDADKHRSSSHPRTQKKPTLNSILKTITKFVNTDPNGKDLWNILTALRGPDNWSIDKAATTAVLRHNLGFTDSSRFMTQTDCLGFAEMRKNAKVFKDFNGDYYQNSDHFRSHIQRAFKSAGLKWDEVNK